MVSSVKNGVGRKGYQIILWAILLGLPGSAFLVVITNFFSSRQHDVIARVGGLSIGARTYNSSLRKMNEQIKNVRASYGEIADQLLAMSGISEKNVQDVVVRRLIEEKMLVILAHQMGIRAISPQYITSLLHDPMAIANYLGDLIPQNAIKMTNGQGAIDQQILQEYIRRSGISEYDYEEQLEDRIKNSLVARIVETMSYTTKAMQKNMRIKKNCSRVFEVNTFDFDEYLTQAKKEKVTEKQLSDYFAQQNTEQKKYWTDEKRSGTVWTFSADNFSNIAVTDVEMRGYYGKHKNEFGDKQYDAVKDDIKKRLRVEQFAKVFNNQVRVMRNNPKAIVEFAANNKGVKTSYSNMSLKDLKKKTGEEEKAESATISALFSIAKVGGIQVLEAHEKEVKAGTQSFMVLDAVEPSVCPEFASVSARVEKDFYDEKAEAIREKSLKKVTDAFGTESFAATLAAAKPSAKTTVGPVKYGEKEWQELAKKYPIQRMENMIHVGDAFFSIKEDKGYIVVLKEIQIAEGAANKTPATGAYPEERLLHSTLSADMEKNSRYKLETRRDGGSKRPVDYYDDI